MRETSTSDATLVAGVIAGDEGAAASLWDRYSPLVRGILTRALGNVADVDDLLQDVFIKLFRGLSSLADVNALRSYVVSIALTTMRSELRKRRVRRFIALAPRGTLPEQPVSPADLGTREALRHLHEALDHLRPDDRIVFCLRYMELMELPAIAALTGASLATTKRYLARAKKRLWVLVDRDPVLAPYLSMTVDARSTHEDGVDEGDAR